ncbi:hypothetical protein F5B21DRAFT_529197 [Xylaria acuta]|nr:hypothetical protein F5B21DRAFT_529197 [Xylaria acuta]
MPSHSGKIVTCVRIVRLFVATISLAIAGLSSAEAHFAIILRDRAKSDLPITIDPVMSNAFISFMSDVLISAVVAALASATCAIVGALVALPPSRLQKYNGGWAIFVGAQLILALFIFVAWEKIADDVAAFQAAFDKFGSNDNLPYYDIIYCGGKAQATYGILMPVFLVMLWFDASVFHGSREKEYELHTITST